MTLSVEALQRVCYKSGVDSCLGDEFEGVSPGRVEVCDKREGIVASGSKANYFSLDL
jgi:hypothetical protein